MKEYDEHWLVRVARENRIRFQQLTLAEQKYALEVIEKRRAADPCYKGIERRTKIKLKPEFENSPRWQHVRKVAEEVRNWPEHMQRARAALRRRRPENYDCD